MSLLMDALRKAEQDKAKNLAATDKSSSKTPTTTADKAQTAVDMVNEAATKESLDPSGIPLIKDKADLELSLPESQYKNDPSPADTISDTSLSLEDYQVTPDTFADTGNKPLTDTAHDDSLHIEDHQTELDPVSAAVKKDVKHIYQGTPVNAQMVFHAIEWRHRNTAWLLLFATSIILATAALLYARFFFSPPETAIGTYPSIIVAEDQLANQFDVDMPPSHIINDHNISSNEITDTNIATASETENNVTPELEQISSEHTLNSAATKLDVATVVEINETITSINLDTTTSADKLPAAAATMQSKSSAFLSPTASMQITKSVRKDYTYPALLNAYTALQSNDLNTAQRLYEQFLQHSPNNRDALIGLASIAIQQNNTALAYQYYQRVLAQNINDNIAMAGLINLSTQVDSVVRENALKELLVQSPNTAHIHFILGNLYADRKSWLQAQAAFFEAYTLADNNPNFALNLAVSLDHLGKFDSALNYYQTALQLAETHNTNFDSRLTKKRILALHAITDKTP